MSVPKPLLSLAWAALLTITAFAYRFQLRLGFTDTDALADYAAARAEGLSGWLTQLTLPLTAGVGGANANFWRPGVMLHYALQRALFDDNTRHWQAWDLGLHLSTVAALGLAARSLGLSAATALLAGTIFALHPLGVEIVPAVARNIDVLVALFSLAAIGAAGQGRAALTALLGLCALCFKETALAAMPVALLALLWRSGRARAAWVAGAWAVGVPLYLVARTAVLSGLGGYYEEERTFTLGRLGAAVRAAPWESLFPGFSLPLEPLGEPLRVLGAVALCGVLGVVAVRRWRDGAPAAALGLLLWGLPILLYGLTGTYSRRLLYLPSAGLALTVAEGVALLAAPGARALGAVCLGFVLSLIPASPLVHEYTDWAENDAVTRSLTTAVAPELAALPPGSVVWVIDRCVWINSEPLRARTFHGKKTLNNCVATYSLQAWADDRFGPGHLSLRALTSTQPEGPLPTPEVSLTGGALVLRRAAMRRALTGAAKDAGWT
ncbi:MAG: hypothetical protein RIT28_4189, partial [Pseudomonadota bacterium]